MNTPDFVPIWGQNSGTESLGKVMRDYQSFIHSQLEDGPFSAARCYYYTDSKKLQAYSVHKSLYSTTVLQLTTRTLHRNKN